MGFNNNEKEDKNFIEYQFETEPAVNVIDKDKFEERISKVFDILWKKLSKSFGPGGAGTFISVYPSYFNTKDGFTIMKNISFDKKLDQVICDIAMSICNRLNFTVGDGTTTAIIATRSIYNSYKNKEEEFSKLDVLPRDIIKRFEYYKNILLKSINESAISIQSDNPEELRSYIEKVVKISSNNNEELTKMISDLYAELKYPAISAITSPDGITRSYLIDGYKLDISLTDKLYINNDNNSLLLNDADFIMFDHKVGRETYEKILKPLAAFSHELGRRLVCIAPYYDETTLHSIISRDLNNEFKATGSINLVLTVCSKISGNAKIMLNDLAMLLNTSLITSSIEDELLNELNNGTAVNNLFNINDRYIEGTNVFIVDKDCIKVGKYSDNLKSDLPPVKFNNDIGIRIGFAKKSEIGMKTSLFSGFYYNTDLYNKYIKEAKDAYAEIRKKCETMGVFSVDLNEKQRRYYSLGLKTGIIEVGGTSELSAGYLKDTTDDAIKAAASAFNNGIVPGCNITLLKKIKELLDNESLSIIDKFILKILYDGFIEVYKTVLMNVMYNNPNKVNDIINESIKLGEVFDLDVCEFNDEVINSAETDKEILKATIDLISLIITGNQLVLR